MARTTRPNKATQAPVDPQAPIDQQTGTPETNPIPGPQGASTVTGEPIAPPDNPTDNAKETAKEKNKKAKIPKATNRDSKPEKRDKIQQPVENTDVEDLDTSGSDITLGRSVNVEEAVAYAMTQSDPVRAIRDLANRRQLKDNTDTFAAMEAAGFSMS